MATRTRPPRSADGRIGRAGNGNRAAGARKAPWVRRFVPAPDVLAAVAGGVVLSLANPPLDVGPLAFLALVPLVLAARRATVRRAVWLGMWFGLAYNAILLSWLAEGSPFAYPPTAIVQAAFPALFAIAIPLLWRDERPLTSSVGLASAWVAVDFLRSITPVGGFTWGAIANTQHHNPLLLPLASVTGAWGVTWVVAFASCALAAVVVQVRGSRTAVRAVAVTVAAAAALCITPVAIALPSANGPSLDIAVVQGNSFQSHPESYAKRSRRVALDHVRLTFELADGNRPDLVVWPENALDVDPLHHA
ncbi:MAG: hypothetical protein ABR600_05230, partial [Actinomycetota bacterium]